MQTLQIHPNLTHLQTSDGKSFFWLGDTAWEMFRRLTRADISHYLQTRARQGFNVIQAVVLAEMDGLTRPNRLGQLPFLSIETLEPNLAYFDLIDEVLAEAESLGLYVALVPCWGDKLTPDWGAGPVIFTADDLKRPETFGRFLGQRYASQRNLIWVLGGDRPAIYDDPVNKISLADPKPGCTDLRPVWRAMAEGIRSGGGVQIMTFHQNGGPETARALHAESWHQFTMFQSGHWQRESPIWDWLEEHARRTPPKPALDGEPCYEDHGVNPWHDAWIPSEGVFGPLEVRAQMYRSVFAGGFGVTYGHHSVWQFADPALYAPLAHPQVARWRDALERPAAQQVRYLRALMESVSPDFSEWRPDQALLLNNPSQGGLHARAMRDPGGRQALIYTRGPRLDVVLESLGSFVQARWFDPTTGQHQSAGTFNGKTQVVELPAGFEDGVLVLSKV
ncbi:MAG: DUF4038 domain-containing protein [Meiothermus sp.]|nr:DUF4038 domain-containing protein [Meiothermus sp.]